ncbi:serine/threonine-protein kinase [Nonomuraea diastatica]|uniref:non-specific serine/threonine protein kinase n=1 Tax=Nonomuraea diastatica TaxID=1848329 RepID=A0A4V2Y9V5_9ACTN|nr:serine/threonine-protein kinase [Nonomuraea diastatica]TDD01276.1 serine/threonine protein kinase [Nonomuraea diastatica]
MHVIAGRYQLLAPLGAGGAGTVWRARDMVLGREVAVKEVRLLADPARRDRALTDTLREARAAASLNHPAIITVHDVLAEQGQPWIVMDLLPGRSLADLLRESGSLPAGQVAAIGLRVLDALEAAHRRGILHRDVKPGNVMLTDSGEAVLTDFGIATHIDDAPTATAAAERPGAAGSPGYVAPERLRGEPAGPASDLWSLAATLYAAVEGRSPFHRGSPMAIVAAVLTQPPPPPVNAGPFGGVLTAMLDKNPAARPHPQAIRAALQPIAAPLPARRSVMTATTVPVASRKSRLPVVLGGLAAATAVAVTAVVLVNASATTEPPRNTPIAQAPPSAQPPVSTPATTPAPEPKGDGAFAAAPDACRLVTDQDAAKIMPGVRRRAVGLDPTKCDWAVGILKDVVNIEITHAPQVATAQKIFTSRKRAQASKKGSAAGSTYQAVRDVQGLGDGAFAQNWWSTTFPQAHSIVWVRVSNLFVEIDATAAGSSTLKPEHQDRAVKVAHAIVDALGDLPSSVPSRGTG